MAGSVTTRTLVLGIVNIFEPANGYQLRRELLSWRVEEWANVNPGSIYSMLTTLTRQGMVEAHVLRDGARDVTIYTITADGRAEFTRLVRQGVVTVSAMDPTLFRVALSFSELQNRADFVGWLGERRERLVSAVGQLDAAAAGILADRSTPPQVGLSLELEARLLSAELEWLDRLLASIESGMLGFAGEPPAWSPAADDQAWEMARDVTRYRELLGMPPRPGAPDRTAGSRTARS
jgi:DNA-binding PadR family transcriptional regulator